MTTEENLITKIYVDANTTQAAYVSPNGLAKITDLPRTNVNRAEMLALVIALKALYALTNHLVIYTDSLSVVRHLTGECVKDNLRYDGERVMKLLDTYSYAKIEWCSREKNIAGRLLDKKQVVLNNPDLENIIQNKRQRIYNSQLTKEELHDAGRG